jgi:DNA-binding MarR family transcriptional regulator
MARGQRTERVDPIPATVAPGGIDSRIVTDAAGLASDLRLAVHRLTRTLRAQRPVDGLTLTQLSALVTIWREGPLSAGDVAAREGVKPPSATRVLAVLESSGLISRATDPADGRQVLLQVTAAGLDRIERDLQARDAWLAQRVDALTAADRRRLAAALDVIKRLAEQ